MSKSDPFSNLSAEKCLLGSLIVDIRRLDEVALIVKPECFYSDVYGQVFSMMLAMQAAGHPIDKITLKAELLKTGLESELTGGLDALVYDLGEAVYLGHYADYHAKIVFQTWRRRLAMTAANAMFESLKDHGTDLDDALGICDSVLRSVEEAGQPQQQTSIAELLFGLQSDEARQSMGIETGFPQLDEMLSGLHGGQLIVLAARPGVGKSALAGNIAQNLAQRGDGVLFVSLEMSRNDLIYRLVGRISGLRLWMMKSKDVKYHDDILNAMNSMMKWPLWLDDKVPRTVSDIAATARILVRRSQVKLIVVDYLQLIAASANTQRAPREQQVAQITRELKVLSKQLNLPIIALSQLNREAEKGGVVVVRRPRLSDLRESGAIEQDADVVAFVHRPSMSDATLAADEGETESAELIVAKQRQGPTGTIPMTWDGTRFLFAESPKPPKPPKTERSWT